jgi:hypothetical protein
MRLEVDYEGGRKHGRFFARVQPGYFNDPRIACERGRFCRNHACGVWTLHDDQGRELQRLDLGESPITSEEWLASPALEERTLSTAGWSDLSRSLAQQKQVAESLLAAARAAGTAGDALRFRAACRETTPPLSAEAAETAAQRVIDEHPDDLAVMCNALLRGASPARLLHQLAIELDRRGRRLAALDLVNAALALTPNDASLFHTRAVVHINLGRREAASQDVERLESSDPARAGFLRLYLQVLFPRFAFWPARETSLETWYRGLPERPAQDLEAIQRTAQKLATRLMAVRTAILQRGVTTQESWLVPDVGHVLPSGVAELRTWSFEAADPNGGRYSVHVDETLQLETATIPELLVEARSSWAALCWVCWACGMDHIGLPENMNPPADFGKAVGVAAQRLWQIRRHMAKEPWDQEGDTSGFHWEGIHLPDLPTPLAEIAERELAESQAVLYWLCASEHQSPWQDNLRGS